MTTRDFYPQHFARLVDEARSVEVAELDGADPAEVRVRVLPRFVRTLEDAIATLGRLETDLRQGAEETPAPIDLPAADEAEAFGNLCYIVRGELERRLAAFDRLRESDDTGDLWSQLEALEWAQHELIRGLCAVESQLASALGTEAATAHVDLLEESLAVRALASGLRSDLAAVSHPGANGLGRSLEAAGESLVRLTERTGFGRLRALDRRMARELHHRIVDWLQHPAPSLETGKHLWQEVSNFSVLLQDISRRSELVAHDLEVLDEVIDLVSGVAPREPPPTRLLRRLLRLSGLDDELDSLVRSGAQSREIEERVLSLYETLRSRWSLDSARNPLGELAAHT